MILTGSIDRFVVGGRTICFSRDRITIFHNSFNSLFKTDLSQIWAYVLSDPEIENRMTFVTFAWLIILFKLFVGLITILITYYFSLPSRRSIRGWRMASAAWVTSALEIAWPWPPPLTSQRSLPVATTDISTRRLKLRENINSF